MKKYIIFLSIICLVLVGAFALAETPVWIQTEERLVGENSTQYEDTLNRPVKSVWNTFLVGHDSTGNHTLTAADVGAVPQTTFDNYTSHSHPLPTLGDLGAAAVVHSHSEYVESGDYDAHTHSLLSLGAASQTDLDTLQADVDAIDTSGGGAAAEFALTDDGAINLAKAYFGALTAFDADKMTVWGVVSLDTLKAQSFHSRIETEYAKTIWNFGADSNGKLFFLIGDPATSSAFTYRSTEVYFDSGNLEKPVEVGVMYDRTAALVTFFGGGRVEASQASSVTMGWGNGAEEHTLGEGLEGRIYTMSIQSSLPFDASSAHTPLKEGLSQCFRCTTQYDMAMDGATLTDRAGGFNLTVTGASGTWADRWIEVPEGY